MAKDDELRASLIQLGENHITMVTGLLVQLVAKNLSCTEFLEAFADSLDTIIPDKEDVDGPTPSDPSNPLTQDQSGADASP